MANQPKAYLSGGPCDGTTVDLTAAEADSASIYCKGAWYSNPGTGKRHNGALVFYFKGKQPTGGGAIKAARAHHGFADVRRSVNHHMPRALNRSQRNTRAALHALSRARRVRF